MSVNLRIGAFGRQESAAAVAVCMFISGCFAFDNRTLFSGGNVSYLVWAVGVLLALVAFELLIRAIRKRGGTDLFALSGGWKRVLAVPAILALLLGAAQPLQQFLLTLTQYVFVDAKQTSVCLYLLPCLALLSMLGAEALVRTSRLILPILAASILAVLLLNGSQYRVYRLFPIPLDVPLKWIFDLLSAFFRAFLPLLMLCCIGEGTQRIRALQSAGRIGAIAGGLLVCLMLGSLSLCFGYRTLSELPSPFYRLLVEARPENPTLRLDRAVLFLWMTGALLGAALYLYAAGVCFCRAFGVRDVRPIACTFCAITVTTILVLYYDTETNLLILKHIYSDSWLLLLPLPLLGIPRKEKKRPCAA